jgi:hypothetical protein
MSIASKSKQLVVETPNKPGTGAALFGALKDAKVNVSACTCHEHGKAAYFRFIPDDIVAARKALRKAKLKSVTEPCILIEVKNRYGAFADVLAEVAALGIDMRHAYASTATRNKASIVMMTSADAKVIRALNK